MESQTGQFWEIKFWCVDVKSLCKQATLCTEPDPVHITQPTSWSGDIFKATRMGTPRLQDDQPQQQQNTSHTKRFKWLLGDKYQSQIDRDEGWFMYRGLALSESRDSREGT